MPQWVGGTVWGGIPRPGEPASWTGGGQALSTGPGVTDKVMAEGQSRKGPLAFSPKVWSECGHHNRSNDAQSAQRLVCSVLKFNDLR